MSTEGKPDQLALATAEEVLRRIYGDDFEGCSVSLQEIGQIIQQGAEPRGVIELIDLYEKLVDAIHLLSTPPDRSNVADSGQLQAILGERLDAIHGLTTKAQETIAIYQQAKKQI